VQGRRHAARMSQLRISVPDTQPKRRKISSDAMVAVSGDAVPEHYCFVSTIRPLNVAS
jgi:hypothetical protein